MSLIKNAIKDYRYLLNKDYPQKALLKLIGDRYRLSKRERNCLFRGVSKTAGSVSRKKKIINFKKVSCNPLGIDWYNVLITVDSYLKGYPLFISDDGMVRDSSGVHGSFHPNESTTRAIKAIIECIEKLFPKETGIYLDSPISHSGDMAKLLREECSHSLSIPYTIEVVPSADFFLKTYKGIIATSDSIICEHAEKIFDLARYVLSARYHFTPPKLNELIIH